MHSVCPFCVNCTYTVCVYMYLVCIFASPYIYTVCLYVCTRTRVTDGQVLSTFVPRYWQQPSSPAAEAATEYPWRRLTPAIADAAHGVGGDRIPELADVAMRRRLPLRNKPPPRPPVPPVKQQVPFRNTDGTSWAPRRGPEGLYDLRQRFTFTAKHGAWVTLRLGELGIQGGRWTLSARQQVEEICVWIDTEAEDMDRADAILAAGGSMQHFRPKLREWILPEKSTNPKALGRVYDQREAGAAYRRGETDFEVPLLAMNDPGSNWNDEFLSPLCRASKVGDRRSVRFMLSQGTIFPFTGNFDSVLFPNARSFWVEYQFATKTTTDEVAAGILDGYYVFPPFSVWKKCKRGVHVVWKPEKLAVKPRGIGDLGLKGSGFEDSSPNGGFELKLTHMDNPKLEYPSNTSFADDCATVRPAYAPGEFMIQQFDWCAPAHRSRVISRSVISVH